MEDPIVILAMPRSGSSMTAGIFASHGVWTGNCLKPTSLNPKGYFENQDIKKFLIEQYGRIAQTGEVAKFKPGLKMFVDNLSPTGKWLAKHSALYWPAWGEFSPKFICVRRSIDGIIKSNQRTGFFGTRDEKRIRRLIDAHNEQMDLSGGVNVYTDAIVAGDYSSLEDAFEYASIDLKPDIVDGFVNKEHWHY